MTESFISVFLSLFLFDCFNSMLYAFNPHRWNSGDGRWYLWFHWWCSFAKRGHVQRALWWWNTGSSSYCNVLTLNPFRAVVRLLIKRITRPSLMTIEVIPENLNVFVFNCPTNFLYYANATCWNSLIISCATNKTFLVSKGEFNYVVTWLSCQGLDMLFTFDYWLTNLCNQNVFVVHCSSLLWTPALTLCWPKVLVFVVVLNTTLTCVCYSRDELPLSGPVCLCEIFIYSCWLHFWLHFSCIFAVFQ